jgi:hypothetical protein
MVRGRGRVVPLDKFDGAVAWDGTLGPDKGGAEDRR